MRETYDIDAKISLSWYQGSADGFVDGSVKMAAKGSSSTHKLGPVVVRMKGSRALATVSATIEARAQIRGSEADLISDTRLLYRAVRSQDAQWRLASLDCIYEKDRLVGTMPGHPLDIAAEDFDGYRPTYRCLSFVLESKGFPVNIELLGDDRPEHVASLYRDAFQWLEDGQAAEKNG
jgi:hypothetical protein